MQRPAGPLTADAVSAMGVLVGRLTDESRRVLDPVARVLLDIVRSPDVTARDVMDALN